LIYFLSMEGMASTVKNMFLKGEGYKQAFAWGWDGKPHSGRELCRRVENEWVWCDGDRVCVGTGVTGPVKDGPFRVLKKGTSFVVMTLEGHQYKLPSDSVRLVTSGVENFWVVQIPTVIRVRYKSVIKDVLCCFGTREEGRTVALFQVEEKSLPGLPDGFFFTHLTAQLEEEGMPRTSPAYAPGGGTTTTTTVEDTTVQEKLRALKQVRDMMVEADEEIYKPSTPSYEPTGEEEEFDMVEKPSSPAYKETVQRLKRTEDELNALKSKEADLESALREALGEIDTQVRLKKEMTTILQGGKWIKAPRQPTKESKRQELMEQAQEARDKMEHENRRLSGIKMVGGVVHLDISPVIKQAPEQPRIVPKVQGTQQKEQEKKE
jgi:hypothetical protein